MTAMIYVVLFGLRVSFVCLFTYNYVCLSHDLCGAFWLNCFFYLSFYIQVMECTSIEGSTSSETDSKGPRNGDQIKLPGLRPSMSVSDFIGQIELCLSEQITSGNPPFSDGGSEYKEILEDIAQHLLNDNQVAATSDEKSLMSRVNSLCCLLQKDPVTVQNSHFTEDNTVEGPDDGKDVKPAVEESKDASGGKQALGMSRKDSFSDLLLHLPRIASLPKFLFNISEEDGNSHAR